MNVIVEYGSSVRILSVSGALIEEFCGANALQKATNYLLNKKVVKVVNLKPASKSAPKLVKKNNELKSEDDLLEEKRRRFEINRRHNLKNGVFEVLGRNPQSEEDAEIVLQKLEEFEAMYPGQNPRKIPRELAENENFWKV